MVKKAVELKFGPEQLDKLKVRKWAWKNDSVDSFEFVNVLQFLKPAERIAFMNELFRVLKRGGKAMLVTPHWSCNRAYADMAFEWPPVVEAWYFHLNAEWRKNGNPREKRYRCDFAMPTWGYGMHPAIVNRNQEYQQHAVTYFKEAAQDLIVTLTKPV